MKSFGVLDGDVQESVDLYFGTVLDHGHGS